MRIAGFGLLALVAGVLVISPVGCNSQKSAGTSEKPDADEVLTAFARKVHQDVLANADPTDDDKTLEKINAIAAEMLAPHKDVLLDKAKGLLEDLPRLDLGDRSGWEVVAQDNTLGDQLRRDLELGHVPASTQPDSATIATAVVLLCKLWDPSWRPKAPGLN